jgi:hypothetical protein
MAKSAAAKTNTMGARTKAGLRGDDPVIDLQILDLRARGDNDADTLVSGDRRQRRLDGIGALDLQRGSENLME